MVCFICRAIISALPMEYIQKEILHPENPYWELHFELPPIGEKTT
jgi:hypothetical protein